MRIQSASASDVGVVHAAVKVCHCLLRLCSMIMMIRDGTIPEITMRYVSRYLSHDTIRITILR